MIASEYSVDSEFMEGVKSAENHVEEHPGERAPARPVPAPEHKCSKENGQELDEFDETMSDSNAAFLRNSPRW